MTEIYASQSRVIDLGRLGENQHRQIVFDVSDYTEQYPDAAFTLINQRPDDASAYPVASVMRVNDKLFWTVTSTDLTRAGNGRCELLVLQGDVVAKSVIYLTRVGDALDGSGTAPEPWESWQTVFAGIKDEAEAAAADAQAASQAVQDMGATAETMAPGADATVEKYIDEHGTVTLAFGIPRGDKGDTGDTGATGADGYSPTVTVTDITGGHRVTITDATGEHSFDVMDGQGGGGGTSDYQALTNKPQINGVMLSGNKTQSDLGINVPTKVSDLDNDAGFITGYTETDPTVPAWAKAQSKPAYTAAEVGALPDSTVIPTKASDLIDDSGHYTKPAGGIPASDIASGVIPTVTVTVLTPSGNTHTLEPCPVTYSFGEKSELTVTVTASSEYHFMFSCPASTPTVLTMTGITGRAGDTLAAGKTYEVDIWAGIALVKEIEVTAV